MRNSKYSEESGTQPDWSALSGQIPGFMYVAQVTSSEFRPLSCIGGFEKLTGFPVTDFMRGDFFRSDVVSRRDRVPLRKFRARAASGSLPASIRYEIVTREGNTLEVEEKVTLLSTADGGKAIGGIVSLAGEASGPTISGILGKDMHRYEELEKLNRHLLEVNQLKDEFLANTSHELRTPLNSIIGFLTLITEGYYESVEELKIFTRNALESSYHLLNVINDLLDISRIESGKMQIQIEKVYVNELLDQVYETFKVQADEKGLNLEVAAGENPVYGAADVRKLKQVLINLAGNAIKFTSEGGVSVSAVSRDGQIEFRITDTGIGIPKDKYDKLFQKFIQLDGSATRRFGGSGLGLVISKHLVEMMGGHIDVESKGTGLGTTVFFTIPKWPKEET